MKVLIAGVCGRVGLCLVKYLLEDNRFIAGGVDLKESKVTGLLGFWAKGDVIEALPDAVNRFKPDVIVNATPGSIGYEVNKRALELGVPVLDVSFFDRDLSDLERMAARSGRWCVVDCGIAPGISNMTVAVWAGEKNSLRCWECFVGGFPEVLEPPLFYEPLFSWEDVIAEYTRPARYVKDGDVKVVDPLSDVRLFTYFSRSWGVMYAIRTDGLRSLLHTFGKRVEYMAEWTLRPPQHIDVLRLLKEAGVDLKHLNVSRKGRQRDVFFMRCIGELSDGKIHELVIEARGDGKINALVHLTALTLYSTLVYLLDAPLGAGVYPPEKLPGVKSLLAACLERFKKHAGAIVKIS